MKEEDVMPGTIYPLFGNMLFFLPERLKKKLCCMTPLGERVRQVISHSWQKGGLYGFSLSRLADTCIHY